jgi:hypothetical protein
MLFLKLDFGWRLDVMAPSSPKHLNPYATPFRRPVQHGTDASMLLRAEDKPFLFGRGLLITRM